MDRLERIALGTLVLVVAGFAIFVAAMQAEWGREAQYHAELAYAKDNLGGAGYAAIAKGGDPDAGGTQEEKAGESGNEGNPVSQAAEEAAAERAFPAQEVTPAQTATAQRTFNTIKIRGNKGSKKGAFVWNSIGPTVAFQPGVLGFTGQDYVTSGRAQAILVDRKCNQGQCRVWIAAAGGGVWTTKHGLHTNNPGWSFSSEGLGSNAFGTLVQDPTDPSGNTLYAGTGEPNASGDSEAGVGIYKSTDGGDSWKLVGSTDELFNTRAVSSIAIDPSNGNVMYASIARAVRGVTSVSGGAVSRTGADQPTLGVYKTTNGGATWSLVWDAGTINGVPDAGRGASRVAIDPLDRTTVYASAYQLGIYRSKAGSAFQQVFAPQAPTVNTDRTMFALTVKNGKGRIYATNGALGPTGNPQTPFSALYRVDDASQLVDGNANTALWKKLTTNVNGEPGYATFDFCTGQCWYDQDVATPAGEPDTVFVLGSYTYGELGLRSNARGVVRSTTAGEPDPAANNRTFTDVTVDAAGNTLHPDQHEIAFAPGNPGIWWEASDGGIARSSGEYADISSQCDSRPLGGASMLTCHRLLSAVPTRLYSLNEGLTTLQFQSISVNPKNPTGEIMGGTQDNGTWLYSGSSKKWTQTIYGDGGQSGFDVANPAIRFNQFFGGFGDVNFRSGDPTAWVIATAPPLISGERVAFYWPEIADPKVGGTIFTGFQHVWRTKDNGGDQFVLETNCPEFTTPGNKPGCGDFEALGGAAGDLTAGPPSDRGGGTSNVAVIERASTDTGTMWAGTSTGRIFVSRNADAEPASAVTYTRIDSLRTPALPNRFPSGIAVDPANPNHAWISYSGYNSTTGSVTPGHVFEVTFDPVAKTATWTDRSYDLGDLPLTDIALDDTTGDVYVSNDFGVLRLAKGTTSWSVAGEGLPVVEVPGLTIVPGARRLYAATHGMSAWYMNLP